MQREDTLLWPVALRAGKLALDTVTGSLSGAEIVAHGTQTTGNADLVDIGKRVTCYARQLDLGNFAPWI